MTTYWLHYHYAIAGYQETSDPVDEDTEYILMLLDVEYESEEYVWLHSRMIPQSMPNSVNITEQAPMDEVIRGEQNLMFSTVWDQQIPRISRNVLI